MLSPVTGSRRWVSRAAGATHGQVIGVDDLRGIATSVGRPVVQRSTLYGAAAPVAG